MFKTLGIFREYFDGKNRCEGIRLVHKYVLAGGFTDGF